MKKLPVSRYNAIAKQTGIHLKICQNMECLAEFTSASIHAQYCPDCKVTFLKEKRREKEKLYRQDTIVQARIREARRERNKKNSERIKEYRKKYEAEHKEEINARRRARRAAINAAKPPQLPKPPKPPKPPRKRSKKVVLQEECRNNLIIMSSPTSQSIAEDIRQWERNGEFNVCKRMGVKARFLPCGEREECFMNTRCPNAKQDKRPRIQLEPYF